MAEGLYQQAITEINTLLDDDSIMPQDRARLLVARGKSWWSVGDRRKALNDYEEAASLDPSGPGKQLIDYTMGILDFYDTNLYNP